MERPPAQLTHPGPVPVGGPAGPPPFRGVRMSPTALHTTAPEDRIAHELEDLGDDPDRIADVLWVSDARGRRDDEAAHPLARFLRRRVHLDDLRVCPETGRVEFTDPDGRAFVVLPTPVREFLRRLARGTYPELEVG
jgi:hypothetical protein